MPQNHPDAASSTQTIIATAPGRICLFGEHQDYLGLPVIAMAVDREFRIEFTPTADAKREFTIHTPDLPDTTPQILDIHAQNPRSDDDYCWGIGQTLLEEGFSFPYGGDAVFRSNIPFRAGCSSSSAMSAAWMRLLLEIGEHPRRSDYIDDPERVAYLVYKGEKEKFAGAGGMMDQVQLLSRRAALCISRGLPRHARCRWRAGLRSRRARTGSGRHHSHRLGPAQGHPGDPVFGRRSGPSGSGQRPPAHRWLSAAHHFPGRIRGPPDGGPGAAAHDRAGSHHQSGPVLGGHRHVSLRVNRCGPPRRDA